MGNWTPTPGSYGDWALVYKEHMHDHAIDGRKEVPLQRQGESKLAQEEKNRMVYYEQLGKAEEKKKRIPFSGCLERKGKKKGSEKNKPANKKVTVAIEKPSSADALRMDASRKRTAANKNIDIDMAQEKGILLKKEDHSPLLGKEIKPKTGAMPLLQENSVRRVKAKISGKKSKEPILLTIIHKEYGEGRAWYWEDGKVSCEFKNNKYIGNLSELGGKFTIKK